MQTIRIVKAITLPLTLLLLILAFTVGIAHSQTVNGKYDGDGDRLIEVSSLEQLNAVRYDVNGDGRPDRDSDAVVYALAFPVGGAEAVCDEGCHGYELAGPLDFGEAGSYASGAVSAGWSSGSGWEPIGVDTSGRRFNATFDGNGHTVSNLYIDRAIGSDRSSGVGLFGVAGESGVIRGIGLVNAEVHGYSQVGGLVGKHSGTISDSYATGNVTGSDDDVGGLVGENSGQVSDSYATGGVTGSGNSVGGLVGRSTGPISDSYATGSVTGRGDSVGGLVGEVGSHKTVIASYATGSVSGRGSSFGGLVGYARSGATFTASYATGNVSGDSEIGGLVGHGSHITVIAGYATGSVTASSGNVGGLVGHGPGATVIASYATGRVSGVSGVGGLFGYGPGTTVIASYWDTGTSGQTDGVGSGSSAGVQGKTTAELQSPTGDTGIYVAWNTDLDDADVDGNPGTGAEDYWDFGTSSQYPALKADIDGNGVATWQEFGSQGRVPPPMPPLLPTPPPTVNGKYDGDGDRLIEVSSLEQLNAVRYDVNGDGRPDRDSDAVVYALAFPVGGAEAVCDKRCHGYELAGPLDFGEAGSYASGAVSAGWSSGSGWEPIGVDTSGRRFNATFDGNGHTVSNLYIDRAIGSDRSSGVGLFGVAGESGVIRGIGLVNAEVHGYSQVGGLVGKHSGTISDSYATGNVTGSDDDVGGLVGENSGQVSDSYATGGVTGSGNSVGGLVGRSTGPISDSYATGSVTGRGDSVGGLVGEVGSHKTVIASYATGSVSGRGSSFGGLVGYARSGATFTASYATGNVSGDSEIGGLVGHGSHITVIAGYATGSVTASSGNVGGLVGHGPGATVIASYATGRVSGVSGVGGLFGYGPGTTVIASYWDTGTSGQTDGVGSGSSAGVQGKTTAELQSPTGDTGIYVAWNTDLDDADVDGNPGTGAEDYWDFGTSSQYPALKADIDGNGVATWQEFGSQGRVPPPMPPLLPTPEAPTAMAQGPTQINLLWSAPGGDGGTPITAYDLRHIETGAADKSDANWTLVEDVWVTGSGLLQHVLTGLTGGTQYDVQVRAVTAAGEGEWSATATETTDPPVVPGAPTGLTAPVADGKAQVVLSWTSPTDTGGAPITGYKIEASDDGNNPWTGVYTTTGDATGYTDEGADSNGPMFEVGTTRYYRVSAINSAGTGAPSNVAITEDLVTRYDANANGTIEKGEVIAAINDYLFGEGDEAISKGDVIKLINLYLFG